ncbi:MAG: class I SAM-dependent methyltransferase, partial [Pseudomonadota bacterium]
MGALISDAPASGTRKPVFERLGRLIAPVKTLGAWIASPLQRTLRRRAAAFFPDNTRRVLEVGVGRGHGLSAYPPRIDVTGIETDGDRLQIARRRVAGQALDRVEGLHRRQPSALAFADASFDAVTAMGVLRRNARATRVIDELVRVTRPGGRIILVDRKMSAPARTTPARGRAARSSSGAVIQRPARFSRGLRQLLRRRLLTSARALPQTLLSFRKDLEHVATMTLFGFTLSA